MNRPYIQFKIKLGKGDLRYSKVFIFKDKKTMDRFYHLQLEHTGQEDKSDFRAMYQPFESIMIKDGKETSNNHIGNFLLNKHELGSGLIAHECGHAAMDYWRRLSPREMGEQASSIHTMEQEEEFLFILAYLVSQFWTKYFKYQKDIESL